MTTTAIRKLVEKKNAPVFSRHRRRSKRITGFFVSGPDGDYHHATTWKEAMANLAVRVRIYQPTRWKIIPAAD